MCYSEVVLGEMNEACFNWRCKEMDISPFLNELQLQISARKMQYLGPGLSTKLYHRSEIGKRALFIFFLEKDRLQTPNRDFYAKYRIAVTFIDLVRVQNGDFTSAVQITRILVRFTFPHSRIVKCNYLTTKAF